MHDNNTLKLNRTVDPVNPAVTDTNQKDFAKIDLTDDDTLVTSLNVAAVTYIEDRLQRGFITQTWEVSLDAFPLGDIELFRSPAIAITSIKYIDNDGNSQTLAADQYALDLKVEPPVVDRAFNVTWPATREQKNAVTVLFTVGYGDDDTDVPLQYQMVIKQMFSHLFRQRDVATDKKTHEVPEHLNTLIEKLALKTMG